VSGGNVIFAINGGAFNLAGQLANLNNDSNSLLITNGANISSYGQIVITPAGAIALNPAFNQGTTLGGTITADGAINHSVSSNTEVRISNTTNEGLFAATARVSSRLRIPFETKANNASGNTGDIAVDASYIYVCTASNTWKRVTLSTY
jgi:hypothetical protein